ncbi:MAG: DUF5686 and carboxypeptidase regulatory-like domain-containing protein [Bacteroidales bacterium]|nr:DUF5686 and carboxypeptidase regulatory-like domain-containing protein [Bacteroidales bacterium]
MQRILLILLALLPALVSAQSRTWSIAGTVTDHLNGDPLPFVQITVPNSKIGTVSDINGHFDLTVGTADTLVQFRMVGYRTLTLPIPTKATQRMKVTLQPDANTLATVNITAQRSKKDRYRRKDNPAVELMKQVVAHKEQNHFTAYPHFSRQVFEKLNMCLDQFHPDFQKHAFWKHFPFVEKYIDRAEFDGAEILHFSIHEKMSQQEYVYGRMRTLVTAHRADGIDANLSQEGLNDDFDVMFAPADIYDNDIMLMSVHFVSPLSSSLANTFYHYFITDTVEIDGQQCIELSFVPAAKGNFGFVGSMYIVNDSSYAVRRYNMRVPEAVDLNFVRDLSVLQDFTRDSSGRLLPSRSDVYGRFYVGKKLRQIYVHQLRYCHQYAFDSSATTLPDSIFTGMVTSHTLPNAHKVRRKQWNETRPLPLSIAETFLDSMRYELMRIPSIKYTIRTAEALATNYIPTHSSRESSRFDIGPIYNVISHNGTEGLRLRLGGMTTAQLNNRNFADGYVAYGFNDRKVKFNLNYIHTFAPKRRFPTEWPLGYLAVCAGYDIESPGMSFDQYARDNFLMWTDRETPAQYVADLQVRLRKQWPSSIGLDTWVGTQHITPTGMLNYYRTTNDGTERVNNIWHTQWATSLSFTPHATNRGGRSGETSLLNLAGNASSFSLRHEMGWLDHFYYNRTTASYYARLWLSAFGYIDLRAQGGIIWNSVPMPKLFTPYGNASDLLIEGSFNTMRPMEFMMDRYLSLMATYHLKGLILNRIPIIKRLRLREVLSFNLLYGGLSSKNDPYQGPVGLYLLPANSQFLNQQPYMEYGIGIENILKLIRIDYVRRLTYLSPTVSPHAVKITLQFTL